VKHIIIEGCDGAGKTTLITHLMEYLPLVQHARASDSKTGPVPNLSDWIQIDLMQLEERPSDLDPYIYDRHPLISELLYGPIRWHNRTGPLGSFRSREWIVKQQRRMANLSTLVICSPPYEEVERVMQAQGREAHMPGVFENRFTLWTGYNNFTWPGTVIRYDRTRDTAKDLAQTLEKMN